MSRDLPTEVADAVEQTVVRPFLAIHIDLPDPVWVFTGKGTITFDDSNGDPQEWIGAGGIGAIDAVGESSDGSATGIRASLLNVPAEFRDDIADQGQRGALFEVFYGGFDEAMQQVTGSVVLSKYKLDDYKITDTGTTITVEVTGESRSIDQKRPAIKRFSHEYQTRRHSGDLFFEYLSKLATIQVLWARADQSGAGSIATGGNANSGFAGAVYERLR